MIKNNNNKIKATSEDVRKLQRQVDELALSREARQRLCWLLHYADHGHNASATARYFGIARSTFLRWAERFDPKDPCTLEEESRRPHTVRTSAVEQNIIDLIREYRERSPFMNKNAIKEALRQEHSVGLSSSTIGRIIRRHKFFFADTLSHRTKLEKALQSPPPPVFAGTHGYSVQRLNDHSIILRHCICHCRDGDVYRAVCSRGGEFFLPAYRGIHGACRK